MPTISPAATFYRNVGLASLSLFHLASFFLPYLETKAKILKSQDELSKIHSGRCFGIAIPS